MPGEIVCPHLGDANASVARPGSPGSKRPAERSRQLMASPAKEAEDILPGGAGKVFEVRCESRDQRRTLIATTELIAVVAQRIRRNNFEQMWDSVIIRCAEEEDGTIGIRILVTNPDWHEWIQIAHLRSRPNHESSLTALGCNLDHVSLGQLT